MLTIALTYNLKKKDVKNKEEHLEWDTPGTLKSVIAALQELGRVIPIEAGPHLFSNLEKYKKKIDLIFNIAEGRKGPWREAVVPIIAEELEVPYTGADPAGTLLCLDKGRMKEILAFHKLPYPSYKVFTEVPEVTKECIAPLDFPLIVKPLYEGSSKGIKNTSLVMNERGCQREIARIIQRYKQPAIVEEFISGREFTVGILGNGRDILVLPIVELNFSSLPEKAAPVYSYEAKWLWDTPQRPLDIFKCPAKLDKRTEEKVKKTALDAYKVMGCRDWCRVDMRMDTGNNPYILELNPIPGILPDPKHNSCLPKAAYALGWDYNRLISTVVKAACKRYGKRYECRSHSCNT